MIEFFCPGIARPKGSKRMVRSGARTRLLEESKREKPWSKSVAFAATCAMQGHRRFVNRPLAVLMVFGMPRPNHHYTTKGLRPDAPLWHVGKPDSSKLARSVEDALNTVVWCDDSRVAQLFVFKAYSERDQSPGVAVMVALADGLKSPDEDARAFYRRLAAIGVELEERHG